MTDVLDDYLRRLDENLPGDERRRAEIVKEVRSHLADRLEDVAQREPQRTPAEREHHVLSRFGTPEDVARGYGASLSAREKAEAFAIEFCAALVRTGVEVRDAVKGIAASARTRYRNAKGPATPTTAAPGAWTPVPGPAPAHEGALAAVGRGMRSLARALVAVFLALLHLAGTLILAIGRIILQFAKAIGIVLLVVIPTLLLAGTVVALVRFDDIRALVDEQAEEDLLDIFRHCEPGPCANATATSSFLVPARATQLIFQIQGGAREGTAGVAHVRIRDPAGILHLDRTLDAEQGATDLRIQWPPTPGSWKVQYELDRFEGWFSLDADARGA